MKAIYCWAWPSTTHTWVGQQNAVQGVAPSRAQLIDQALALVPSSVPDMIRKKVVAALASSARSQRRWLAKFRHRWGLRLGKLKVQSALSIEEKQKKDGQRL